MKINNFPSKGQSYTYLQTNRSDDLGSIWSSFNLDFQSNLGTMRVSPRLKLNVDTQPLSASEIPPSAFENSFNGTFYAIAGGRTWVGGSIPPTPFILDPSSNNQTTYTIGSDLENFNDQLFATTNTALFSLDGNSGTWTDRSMSLTAGQPHMMTYFKKFDRLYVARGINTVGSIDTSYAVATSGDYTLDTNTEQNLQIVCIKASSNRIWIGMGAFLSPLSKGRIYEWDGISAQVTNEYILDANSCMSLVIQDDIPYAMDSNGSLLKFTGSDFSEIGRLPTNYLNTRNVYNNTGAFIHQNGLVATKNGTILALIGNINNDSGATLNENLPSGVWEWSPDFGFTHKYSFSYNPVSSSTITDFGQNKVVTVGALTNTSVDLSKNTAGNEGTIMLGAQYYKTASTTTAGIFIDNSLNTIQKKGYFVTTWFNSDQVEDKWSRIWAVYRRLLSANDSIVFKYRLYEEEPTYATITWTSTTTFTTTTDITAYGPTATGFNGTIGGEVEIMAGTGGGACAHITSIVNNAGTYTVTLDSAITGVTGTAYARFQKWIKLFPEITGQVKSWEQLAIGANNPRIQIKGCMTFLGNDEFTKLMLSSNHDITATL